MKQVENTLQDLKCMLIEDGYTEANIVMRTLIKAQEQVKNNVDLHNVSKRKYPNECIECGADEDFLQPYDDELFICENCRITLPYVC